MNIKCKKCIIVVTLNSSQQTCGLLIIQAGRIMKEIVPKLGEKTGFKRGVFP